MELLCDAVRVFVLAIVVLYSKRALLQQESCKVFQDSFSLLLLDNINVDGQSNIVDLGL